MRKLMVALVLAAGAAAACSDNTSPNQTVPGNYVLRTVNAVPVPAITYQSPDRTNQVVYGRVSLNEDLSFVDSTRWTITNSGQPSDSNEVYKGTYTVNGDHITMTVPDTILGGTSSYSMIWQGNRLLFSNTELTFTYQK